jgi:predicted DsbA family dithiol-disulfide isomerase
VVCPWCYLGKRRLEAAIEGLEWGDEIEVHWRAYLLDPGAPLEAQELKPVIERKYGPGAFDGMVKRLTALGAEAGIDYRFDLAQRVNSVAALRLLAWAADSEGLAVADQLHDLLFRAYFAEGANIADPASLTRWAQEAGLDSALAAEAIGRQAGSDRVAADLEEAAERQITGVPAFVVDGRFMIPGAQDVETIQAILERARAKRAAAS